MFSDNRKSSFINQLITAINMPIYLYSHQSALNQQIKGFNRPLIPY